VNERAWARLPEEVRNILLEAAADYRDELARETDRRAAASRLRYQQEGGQIIALTDEQRRQWAMGLPNIAQDWARDMEARGLPGSEILQDYMNIMREHDQPIMRHWDRE
jgi:TRAP-type C4-dicarboxylate transport system substrate-binding protein